MKMRFHVETHTILWVFLVLGIFMVGIVDSAALFAQSATSQSVPSLNTSILEIMVYEPYTYTEGNRRDPFLPLPVHGSLKQPDVMLVSESENLQGKLMVLGIISGKGGYQALLTLPNGERVIVGQGSLIKDTTERVKSITRDTVVLARQSESNNDKPILEQTLVLSH